MLSLLGTLAFAGGAIYIGVQAISSLKERKLPSSVDLNQSKTRIPVIFAEGTRRQQFRTISPNQDEKGISDVEKEVNQSLAISISSLGMVFAGTLFYPPLTFLALPGLFYLYIPWFKEAYQSLFKEHRVRMSVNNVILVTGAIATGQFVAVAMLTTFITVSKKLLTKAEDHSQKKLFDVFGEIPPHVWMFKDGVEVETPYEQLKPGDIVVLHAGEIVPIDGIIIKGEGSIDQRILTGESQPIEKEAGAQVFASTVLLSGKIYIQVELAGEETISAQIVEVLNKTVDFKRSLQWQWIDFIDRTTLPTIIIGAISLPILGPVAALSVMWSCGLAYSMRIIAPLNLLNFLNVASHNSILIKDGRVLELLQKVDTIVFDKTGTLTQEQPHVGRIYSCQGYEEQELLRYAGAAEYKQTHPIAKAILEEVHKRKLHLPEIQEASYEVGFGIKVMLNNQLVRVGSSRYIEMEGLTIPGEIRDAQMYSHKQGYSLVLVSIDEKVGGAIQLHPTTRPEAKAVIDDLQRLGMSIHIISGDHEQPTKQLAKELGVTNYFSEILPKDKAGLIKQFKEEGKFVCFVGDGINDAIALQEANISISLCGASTIATDTAQIVLMDSSLNQLVQTFEIAQDFYKTARTSFLLSVGPNIISVGGIIFLQLGLAAVIPLFYTGVALGVGNSIFSSAKHLPNNKS